MLLVPGIGLPAKTVPRDGGAPFIRTSQLPGHALLLSQPPPTPYDVRFSLLGIPVRVHPFFWVVAVLMGINGNEKPARMAIWVGVFFVSILIHEMGHALAARSFGWPPSITLHGFGGLASYRPTYRSPRNQILITAAGPLAGFAFAALVVVFLAVSGRHVQLERDFSSLLPITFDWFPSMELNILIYDLLYVNIFWGLVNLLPVLPLDGGQIANELLAVINPSDGLRQALWLSLVTAVVVAVAAYALLHMMYLSIFFAYLGYTSYQTLQAYFGPGGGLGRFR
jgi:Zn-dependent protease